MNSTNGKTFLDTNILVYAIDRREPKKRERIRQLLGDVPTQCIAISTQTMLEFVSVARKKALASLDEIERLLQLHRFIEVVRVDPTDVIRGLEIMRETQFRIFDCMMIVSAQKAGCSELWSEDMSDSRVVAGVRIVNPFIDLKKETES